MTHVLRRLALCFGSFMVVCACAAAPHVIRADRAPSPVFFSAHGKCLRSYKDNEPDYCRESKFGNVFLPTYTSPRPGEWGIAYAYNCGSKPRWFTFVIDLTMWDQSAGTTSFAVKGKKGKGYYMETGKDATSIAAANAAPGSNGYWGSIENVVIKSSCRWSMKGVDGPETVVAQSVPTIPKRS